MQTTDIGPTLKARLVGGRHKAAAAVPASGKSGIGRGGDQRLPPILGRGNGRSISALFYFHFSPAANAIINHPRSFGPLLRRSRPPGLHETSVALFYLHLNRGKLSKFLSGTKFVQGRSCLMIYKTINFYAQGSLTHKAAPPFRN